MITIRNPNEARARTVVAGEDLEVGMFVKLVQGAAKGDPPKVMKVAEADIADAEVMVGIVDFIPDDDLAVDYNIDTNQNLTVNTGSDNTFKVPSGSLCVFWYGQPIVGFAKSAVDPTYQASFDAAREADVLAIDSDTAKLAAYDASAVDTTRDEVVGVLYQHEGAEITVLLKAL